MRRSQKGHLGHGVPPKNGSLFAQQDQTETTRKIVNRLTPQYPEMARAMNLRGSVKAEALVSPNGTVKSVDVKGRTSGAGAGGATRDLQVEVGTRFS